MLEAKFYETYYFCNIIRNVLHNQIEYIRRLHEFCGDGSILYLLDPFKKYSAFHCFIEFVVEDIYYEEASKVDLEKRKVMAENYAKIPRAIQNLKITKLPIELALEFHSIAHQSFKDFLAELGETFQTCDEDHIYEYMSELRNLGQYEQLVEQTAKEVFHILFQNRNLMMIFNQMMANALESESQSKSSDEKDNLFTNSGVLKRKPIPKWAKRAVFFRDRGRCILCDKDLSGILNMNNNENYDHIVSLARYGLNDISNIQLLCKECNQLEKKDYFAITSNKYQSWYVYDKL